MHRHGTRAGGCQVLGEGGGSNDLMGTEFYLEVMKMFWNSTEVAVTQCFECM